MSIYHDDVNDYLNQIKVFANSSEFQVAGTVTAEATASTYSAKRLQPINKSSLFIITKKGMRACFYLL